MKQSPVLSKRINEEYFVLNIFLSESFESLNTLIGQKCFNLVKHCSEEILSTPPLPLSIPYDIVFNRGYFFSNK
jgi:hypothetical protein